MDPAVAPGMPPAPHTFQDALGDRRRATDATGEPIELLCLRRELTAIPSFEFALRERASRLAGFRHTYYGRVRSVDRLTDPASTLAVVSDFTRGVRLSQLLTPADKRAVTIDINAALHLIRQLVSAVAMLHENAHDVAHGAIGPERVIVTSNARVVIVEYVLGAALEQLRYSRERYWEELRIALPPSPALPRFDQRADVTQIGVVALSLVLGRLLTAEEYPDGVGDVLSSAWAISSRGGLEPLPAGVRSWIARALQLDPRHSFETALDARAELDKVLSGEDEENYETSAPAAVSEPVVAPPVVTAPPVAAPPVVDPAPPIVRAAEPEPVVRPAEPFAPAPPASYAPASYAAAPAPQHSSYSTASHVPAAHHAFDEDVEREPMAMSSSAGSRGKNRIIVASVAAVAVLAVGGFAARKFFSAPSSASTSGTLSVTSNPPGAVVLVDNESRGSTPLSITLTPGPHTLVLKGNGEPRTIPVTIAAGAQTSQYIELPTAAAPATVGQLQIRTEPAGAQVTVDGQARGKSPVLVDNLAAGEHTVVVESDYGTVKQTVTVEAATTASLVVPLGGAQGAPVSGWVSLTAPVELQIFENKRLLGTSQSDRIMIGAGRHELDIVNDTIGYRTSAAVVVAPGKVAPIKIDWPKGTASINALPWAEVWIDGEKIGETPIGNLSLPIGPHEVVFRHPELGEQRYPVSVTLKGTARLSVDLRKKP